MKINKTLEALLRGYVLFRVNERYFLLYNSARSARLAITGDVAFDGLHIFKGWRCFFARFETNLRGTA